jgi:hypothetical protein
MRIFSTLALLLCLVLCSCGGGSSLPGVPKLTDLILEAPNTALRGSEILLTPRGVYAASSSTSTSLAPISITVTVEQGTLLDDNGAPVAALTVPEGTDVRWLLPDSVGTYAARAAYQSFSTSAVVLTTDAPV